MFLDDVRPLIATPPPLSPESADAWEDLEQRIGIVFPSDFKQFIDAYGPGMLDVNIRFHHPTLGTLRTLDHMIEEWDQTDDYFLDDCPYPFAIASGGLLAWGSTVGGIGLAFHMASPDPDQWTVVEFASGEYEQSALPFADWLLRYLRGGGSDGSFVTSRSQDGATSPIEYESFPPN